MSTSTLIARRDEALETIAACHGDRSPAARKATRNAQARVRRYSALLAR